MIFKRQREHVYALLWVGFFGISSSLWSSMGFGVMASQQPQQQQQQGMKQQQQQQQQQQVEYGVDVSMPMHHARVSENYDYLPWNVHPDQFDTPPHYQNMVVQPLGDRQSFYTDMIQKCVDYYGKNGHRCLEYETDRVEMTLRQPQSMENYTDMGFKKIKAPEPVWKLIKTFWDRNKDKHEKENWPTGNTYTNHWTAETRILNVERDNLRGGGFKLKDAIWEAAKSTISEWVSSPLHSVSLYGIRLYTNGSVLSSHVDRLPLVSSAIICVDTDLDEPWPLEVIGHDGKAYNVTMEPGDMVLYESHTVIHGRPWPLKGRFVANLFVHFEPEGHSLRHNAKIMNNKDPNLQYKLDTANGIGGHEANNHDEFENEGLPIYIIPGSPEVPNYIERNPESPAAILAKHKKNGITLAHLYAGQGELEKLKHHIENENHQDTHDNMTNNDSDSNNSVVTATDKNGWTPLHEGARSGNIEVVRYLLSKGADVNHRTGLSKDGYSVLAIAHKVHGPDHPVSKFLKSVGAELMEPEL